MPFIWLKIPSRKKKKLRNNHHQWLPRIPQGILFWAILCIAYHCKISEKENQVTSEKDFTHDELEPSDEDEKEYDEDNDKDKDILEDEVIEFIAKKESYPLASTQVIA